MERFCQSCGMPLQREEDLGTNKDGSKNTEYCRYCYKDGGFSQEITMEQMIEFCIPIEVKAGVFPNEEAARKAMLEYFPQLKRWK